MLEILRLEQKWPARLCKAPTYRVRCCECGREYSRTGYPSSVRRVQSCGCLVANDLANWHRRRRQEAEWAKRRGWDRDVDEAALDAFSP